MVQLIEPQEGMRIYDPTVRLGRHADPVQGVRRGSRRRPPQPRPVRPGRQRQHLGHLQDEHAAARHPQRRHPPGRHAQGAAAPGHGRRAQALRPGDHQSAVLAELQHRGHEVPGALHALHAGEGQEGRPDVRAAHGRLAQARRQAGHGHAARRPVPWRRGKGLPPAVHRGRLLEAVIGLPRNLFYGTGIPACVLVINKHGATNRKHVLFINADREFREGKTQNSLRPEDIEKITQVYRTQPAARQVLPPGSGRRTGAGRLQPQHPPLRR